MATADINDSWAGSASESHIIEGSSPLPDVQLRNATGKSVSATGSIAVDSTSGQVTSEVVQAAFFDSANDRQTTSVGAQPKADDRDDRLQALDSELSAVQTLLSHATEEGRVYKSLAEKRRLELIEMRHRQEAQDDQIRQQRARLETAQGRCASLAVDAERAASEVTVLTAALQAAQEELTKLRAVGQAAGQCMGQWQKAQEELGASLLAYQRAYGTVQPVRPRAAVVGPQAAAVSLRYQAQLNPHAASGSR